MSVLELDKLEPEFLTWLAKNSSQEDRDRYGPYLRDQIEQEKYNWLSHARAEQLPPSIKWFIWLLLAGRGFGKTRTGAETAKSWAGYQQLPNLISIPGSRGAVVAPTFADARDTCIEGDSGLLSVLPPSAIKTWNRSMGELLLNNGTRIKCFSADEPERLRGPQHHWAWCDELAAWRYLEAWDQLMFGLRLGDNPQVVVTTTPRPTKLIRELVKRELVHITTGSTFDNAANLAESALTELRSRYEGTRLGRQELFAEILTDVPGALATLEQLDGSRVENHPELVRVVVSVDPAVTATADSDETGITVVGRGIDSHAYLVADLSCRTTVDDWSKRAVIASTEFNAGKIIYEANMGGDAIKLALIRAAQELGIQVVIEPVTAVKSKWDRALGLQQAIERATFHLCGSYEVLEDQLTTWTIVTKVSPNNLDSAVHGFNEVMEVEKPKTRLRFYG